MRGPTENNDEKTMMTTTKVKILDPIGDQIRRRRSEQAVDVTSSGCWACAFRRRRLRDGCLCNLPRDWILVRGPAKLKVEVRPGFPSVEGRGDDDVDDISDWRRPKDSPSPGRKTTTTTTAAAAPKLIVVWRGIQPGDGKKWIIS